MSTVQYLAAAAAAVVAAWPFVNMRRTPSYQAVIADLARVRRRLVDTGMLADDQKRAIDVLTLALVDGSDK